MVKELHRDPRQARRADDASSARSSSRSATRTRRRAGPRSSPTTSGTLDVVALVEDEPYVVTVTARGYVRAVPERTRKSLVANPGERDAVAQVIDTTALSGLLFFTDRGRAYRATVHELPKEKLTAAQNLFQFGDGEKVVAVLDARMHEEHPNLVFVTAASGGEAHRAERVRGGVGAPERHRRDEARRRRSRRVGVPRLGRLRAACWSPPTARASGSPRTTCGRSGAPRAVCGASG